MPPFQTLSKEKRLEWGPGGSDKKVEADLMQAVSRLVRYKPFRDMLILNFRKQYQCNRAQQRR